MEEEWKHKLVVESNGNVAKTISNLRIIFTHDEELSQIKFDTFCQDDFSFSKRFQNVNGGKIDEESVGKIQDYLEQTYKLRLTQSKVFEILENNILRTKLQPSTRLYSPRRLGLCASYLQSYHRLFGS